MSEFWDIAGELMSGNERLVEGSIMGHPCLRLGKEFVAMPELKTRRIIVKLDASRVGELIDEGTATSFAPAGKVFREWAAVENQQLWPELLAEAITKAEAK